MDVVKPVDADCGIDPVPFHSSGAYYQEAKDSDEIPVFAPIRTERRERSLEHSIDCIRGSTRSNDPLAACSDKST